MASILFDVSAYLDVVQRSVKSQLADAVGVEVVSLPIIGRVINGGYLPFDSVMIQSVRCSLTANRLFGGFGFSETRLSLVWPQIGNYKLQSRSLVC